jgi:Na+/H+-dicarboxylate symporter
VIFKIMGILIKLAPLGVLGTIAFTVGHTAPARSSSWACWSPCTMARCGLRVVVLGW